MSIQFKTPRQTSDFGALQTKNPKLAQIANALSIFVSVNYGKDIVVTDVFRTKEEFDSLYAATPVERRPTDSPHCHYNAFDLRSSIYTSDEVDRIVSFLNLFNNPSGRPVCLYHKIAGGTTHFHVQYTRTA